MGQGVFQGTRQHSHRLRGSFSTATSQVRGEDPDSGPAYGTICRRYRFAVYWRPPNWSVAVIATDAVCFEGAPLSLFEVISPAQDFPQYLVRALLFRLVTDHLIGRPASDYGVYDRAVGRVLELADVHEPG